LHTKFKTSILIIWLFICIIFIFEKRPIIDDGWYGYWTDIYLRSGKFFAPYIGTPPSFSKLLILAHAFFAKLAGFHYFVFSFLPFLFLTGALSSCYFYMKYSPIFNQTSPQFLIIIVTAFFFIVTRIGLYARAIEIIIFFTYIFTMFCLTAYEATSQKKYLFFLSVIFLLTEIHPNILLSYFLIFLYLIIFKKRKEWIYFIFMGIVALPLILWTLTWGKFDFKEWFYPISVISNDYFRQNSVLAGELRRYYLFFYVNYWKLFPLFIVSFIGLISCIWYYKKIKKDKIFVAAFLLPFVYFMVFDRAKWDYYLSIYFFHYAVFFWYGLRTISFKKLNLKLKYVIIIITILTFSWGSFGLYRADFFKYEFGFHRYQQKLEEFKNSGLLSTLPFIFIHKNSTKFSHIREYFKCYFVNNKNRGYLVKKMNNVEYIVLPGNLLNYVKNSTVLNSLFKKAYPADSFYFDRGSRKYTIWKIKKQ